MAFITATVEVDLDEFDTEDLIEELKSRNEHEDTEEEIIEMFYAFKLGKIEHAMNLAKKIAQDKTGMIL